MGSRHKIYVGVDYGTTFSGFAFVTSQRTSVQDIEVITNWPGNAAGYREKVPSQIAYKAENQKPALEKDVWGYEIPPGAKRCCWTKLLLDKTAGATEFDDPRLSDLSEWTGLPIPKEKTAEDVVADYLTHLYRHCMHSLEQRMTQEILKLTPIEFWFTMPAIWSDDAQLATMEAAKRAGFGKSSKREYDTISMIREPEAAALSALKNTADEFDDLVEINTGILVCDCGGGTVDITSYTVAAITPTLKIEESCVGIGAKCGASYVDRNFETLMVDRYGTHYTSLPANKRGQGSEFMKRFEDVRNDFSGTNHNSFNLQLVMRNLNESDPNCIQYDPEDGEITLTSKDLQACFDPVVESIIGLVKQQKAAVAKENAPAIANLVLVGGFSCSPYVWENVKKWCDESSIRAISANRPWSAIARGAALRGLEGAIVTNRRCRRHYGTSLAWPFREGLEVHDSRVYFDPLTEKLWRKGWMSWSIKKGEKLKLGDKRSLEFQRPYKEGDPMEVDLQIYSCSLDNPPQRDDDPDSRVEQVGTVRMQYTKADLSRFDKKKIKRHGHILSRKDAWYDLNMKCEVGLADSIGVLSFTVTCGGKPIGTTKFDCQID